MINLYGFFMTFFLVIVQRKVCESIHDVTISKFKKKVVDVFTIICGHINKIIIYFFKLLLVN